MLKFNILRQVLENDGRTGFQNICVLKHFSQIKGLITMQVMLSSFLNTKFNAKVKEIA